NLRHEVEIVLDRHFGIEGNRLGKVTDLSAHLQGIAKNVVPIDCRGSGRWRKIPTKDAHRRRLAGAIRAQEPQDFARLHVKRHVRNRALWSVALTKVRYLDHPHYSLRPLQYMRSLMKESVVVRLILGGGTFCRHMDRPNQI